MNRFFLLLTVFISAGLFAEEGDAGPRIRTIVIFDGMKNVSFDQLAKIKQIQIEGVLGKRVISVKQPFHFAALNALKKRLYLDCKEKGRQSANVELVSYDFTTGVIKLLVTEQKEEVAFPYIQPNRTLFYSPDYAPLLFQRYSDLIKEPASESKKGS